MKAKIIYIGLFLSITTACSNALEEDPKGMINESFLLSESGLSNLVLSQYYQNRVLAEDLRYLGDFPSDLMTYGAQGSNEREIGTLNTSVMPTLTPFANSWRHLYTGINNTNFGLQALKEISFNGSGTVEGELSFFRAYYYLLVVETWGEGAHFTIEPTSSIIEEGRQTTMDVFYSQILSDIDNAIGKLPPSSPERGRLTAPAAMALKARILLALAGYSDDILSKSGMQSRTSLYTEVKRLADDVIQNYGFTLLDDYASIFDVYNEGNPEIIWAVQFSEQNKFNTSELTDGGHGLHRYWVPNYNRSARTGQLVPGTYGHSIYYGREYRSEMMTKYFLTLFNQQEDSRTDATIQTVWRALWDEGAGMEDGFGLPVRDGQPTDTLLFKPLYNVNPALAASFAARGIAVDGLNDIYDSDGTPKVAARSWYHTMMKHLDPSRTVPKEEASHKDVIILRLGEVYLIAAEAAYFLGDNSDAATYIDDLRKRARKTPDALPVNVGDIDIDYILDERARELGGEFVRWFDLKRTHKLVERVKLNNPDGSHIESFHELRPVPQIELDKITNRDTFKQNPGYPSK